MKWLFEIGRAAWLEICEFEFLHVADVLLSSVFNIPTTPRIRDCDMQYLIVKGIESNGNIDAKKGHWIIGDGKYIENFCGFEHNCVTMWNVVGKGKILCYRKKTNQVYLIQKKEERYEERKEHYD